MQTKRALNNHLRLSTAQCSNGDWKVSGCLMLLVARHWQSFTPRLPAKSLTYDHLQEAARALKMHSESGTLTVDGELAAAYHNT